MICNGMTEKTPHATQKPEALIEKLILASSKPGPARRRSVRRLGDDRGRRRAARPELARGRRRRALRRARPAIECPALLQRRREPHLLEEVIGAVEQVHHPEHVARVDVDRARGRAVEHDVGREALLVAVEREADELALVVERRRAGVAAGDVEVRSGSRPAARRRASGRAYGPNFFALIASSSFFGESNGSLPVSFARICDADVNGQSAGSFDVRLERLHRAVGDAQRRVRVGREQRRRAPASSPSTYDRRDEHQLAGARVVLLLLGLDDRPHPLRGLDERILRRLELRGRALLQQVEAELLVLERLAPCTRRRASYR